jgi:hypothetical protein
VKKSRYTDQQDRPRPAPVTTILAILEYLRDSYLSQKQGRRVTREVDGVRDPGRKGLISGGKHYQGLVDKLNYARQVSYRSVDKDDAVPIPIRPRISGKVPGFVHAFGSQLEHRILVGLTRPPALQPKVGSTEQGIGLMDVLEQAGVKCAGVIWRESLDLTNRLPG